MFRLLEDCMTALDPTLAVVPSLRTRSANRRSSFADDPSTTILRPCYRPGKDHQDQHEAVAR
jgi:hypothetical protein